MTAIDIIQPFWKPVGWTSFDVVKKIRSLTKIRKVGHAGTLDPFAEGVLILCFGAATKRVSELMKLEKEYLARLRLGVATDTLDLTGSVVAERRIPRLTPAAIKQQLPAFTGQISQIPPMYSALKVGGRRLYQLARAGQTVERKPRPVAVHTLELTDWRPPDELQLRVVCGKGTYIRVLAADLAEALGTVGHLIQLTRNRVGPYDQTRALTMKQALEWIPIAT